MNVDTSAVMRVVIENFNMTAKESQRVKMFRCKVIRMKQEIVELKASLARSPGVLRQMLKQVSLDHNYNKPVLSRKLDQRSRIGKSRKSGSPENSKFEIHPNSPEITEYSIHNSSTYEIYEDLH